MTQRTMLKLLLWISLVLVFANGCGYTPSANIAAGPVNSSARIASEDSSIQPTPPNTLPELIASLDGGDTAARVVAAYALAKMGAKAEPAIPALIRNLHYDYSDVQEAAAEALGSMGPLAKSAVPSLIATLLEDTNAVNVRCAAASALGKIGETSSVPSLVSALDETDNCIGTRSAQSVAVLANQKFPDSSGSSFSLDSNGIPLIIKAAKEWWLNTGQNQVWGQP